MKTYTLNNYCWYKINGRNLNEAGILNESAVNLQSRDTLLAAVHTLSSLAKAEGSYLHT